MAEESRPDSYPEIPVNEEAIDQVRAAGDRLQAVGNGILPFILWPIVAPAALNPVSLLFLCLIPAIFPVGTRLRKFGAIEELASQILDEFREEEVEVRVCIPVPEQGEVDLLVRFPLYPQQQSFLVQLRSMGKCQAQWKEHREWVYWKSPKKRQFASKVDYFEKMGLQERWLRKNRPEIFGFTRTERKTPCIKILAIAGQSSLANHQGDQYQVFGEEKVVFAKKRVSIFLMEADQVVGFIKGLRDRRRKERKEAEKRSQTANE
jgi:hypothetical protein